MSYKTPIAFIVLMLLVLPFGEIYAAEISLTPSIEMKGEYNDNINFARTDREEDYIAIISPAITFNWATERLNLQSDIGFNIKRYSDNTQYDTENQRYNFAARYRLLERLSIKGNFLYILDETLDTYLEETGLVDERRSDRQLYKTGGGLSFYVTEVSDVDLDYTYSNTDYDLSSKIDSEYHSVSLSYNHAFNDRHDVLTLKPSYTKAENDLNEETDNYNFTLGFTHVFSETFEAHASAGVRYTETENREDPSDTGSDDWGWTADMYLKTSWVNSHGRAGYKRGLNYNAGGEIIEVNQFYYTLNQMLTERFGIGFAMSFYLTKIERDIDEEDNRFIAMTPSMFYKITENILLSLEYNYSKEYTKYKSISDTWLSRDQNRVWLSLNFSFPQKW